MRVASWVTQKYDLSMTQDFLNLVITTSTERMINAKFEKIIREHD